MNLQMKGYKILDGLDALNYIDINNLPAKNPSYDTEINGGHIHMNKEWEKHPSLIISEKKGRAFDLGFHEYITVK